VGCFGRLGATSAKSTTPRHLARPRRPLLLRRTDRTYSASLLRAAALLRLAAHAALPTQHQRAPSHTSPRRSTAAKRHPTRSTLLRLASTMSTVQGARRWSSGRLFTLRSISVPATHDNDAFLTGPAPAAIERWPPLRPRASVIQRPGARCWPPGPPPPADTPRPFNRAHDDVASRSSRRRKLLATAQRGRVASSIRGDRGGGHAPPKPHRRWL
jgi:hypothetical protein